MAVRVDQAAFKWLSDQLEPPPPPQPIVDARYDDGWVPSLNPTQRKIFDSIRKYILAYGEKGSGKSIGHLHKVVRHCYENANAFGLIVVKEKSMATKGGAWEKLVQHILPEWQLGMGLQFSDVKYDPSHNEFIWIANRFGGWSQIAVISIRHANQVRNIIRGYEPSIVFVDEITTCETVDYLRAIGAQVGRRPGIDGPQQFLAACNPEGPSHWVYIEWWINAFDEETGVWDEDFEKWHVPIQENEKNLPEGYLDNLIKLYKHDPIESDRMLRGLWIDRPSGDSLFRDTFNVVLHVAPLTEDSIPHPKKGLLPIADQTVIIGLDPGSVFNAYTFMQWLPPIPGVTPWQDGLGWLAFDEICLFRRKVAYQQLVPVVMRRMKFWRDQVKGNLPQVWLSDNSAFNQFRTSGQGSYDVLEIEKAYAAYRGRYSMEPMKVKQAPKFDGSRQIRVRLMSQLLAENRILVSSRCVNLRSMLLNLESEKQKPGEFDPNAAMTPKRSDWVHIFDSTTYPIITSTIDPGKLTAIAEKTQQIIEVST